MFRREVKKQFNANKYDYLVKKGFTSKTSVYSPPYQKHLIGTIALFIVGFNYTKRYYTMPHAHKDHSKPLTMYNDELHPFENQPKSAAGMTEYKLHLS